MKALIAFDLDGTLAPSKSAIDEETSALLMKLLGIVRVAIISGGALHQFQEQVLAHLAKDRLLKNMSILPTCGTRFYQYRDGWHQLYSDDLSKEQQQQIIDSLKKAVESSGFRSAKTWGDSIENRDSQITYSALGQDAPLSAKQQWDPDFAKRKAIKALLDVSLPNFSIRLGGSTSIDITKPGIDKAYGIGKLHEILGVEIRDMLYIGDALFPGGNDYPARGSGAACIQVRDPHETKRVIETILACADGGAQ